MSLRGVALLVLCLLQLDSIAGKTIRIAVRENVTIPCPNTNSDVVDRKSLQFKIEELPSVGGRSLTSDQLVVIGANGQQSAVVRFPGCYRVNLKFRLKRPIAHPYIEASTRMGMTLPCESTPTLSRAPSANVCTNLTRPVDWCPSSANEQLRRMTSNQPTCRFCNLCEHAHQSDPIARRYVTADQQTMESCKTDQLEQSLHFQICTPDRKTMHQTNEESDGKFDKYWDYLKQGVLSVVVHVADRRPLSAAKSRQCERLCSTLNGGSARSSSYRNTLDKTINSLCTPTDEYVACIFHTLKFDVLDPIGVA
ncbi:hypothetical protein M3Y99_01236300 [Aphelenchoides fujianensis]|nr:hypothetical protein M3Y99_01236300 [Aphelenchoides fujianensis]